MAGCSAYLVRMPCLPRESAWAISVVFRRAINLGVYLSAPLARIHDIVLVQRRLWISAWRLHRALGCSGALWYASAANRRGADGGGCYGPVPAAAVAAAAVVGVARWGGFFLETALSACLWRSVARREGFLLGHRARGVARPAGRAAGGGPGGGRKGLSPFACCRRVRRNGGPRFKWLCATSFPQGRGGRQQQSAAVGSSDTGTGTDTGGLAVMAARWRIGWMAAAPAPPVYSICRHARLCCPLLPPLPPCGPPANECRVARRPSASQTDKPQAPGSLHNPVTKKAIQWHVDRRC